MVHLMNKSGSTLSFILHQGQVPSQSVLEIVIFLRSSFCFGFCFSAPINFWKTKTKKRPVGFGFGLDLFLLFIPVGGRLLRQEQSGHFFFSPSLYTHDGQKGAWFSVNQSLVKEKQKVKQKRPSCFLSSPNRLCYILYTMYNSINPPHRVFIYTVYRT